MEVTKNFLHGLLDITRYAKTVSDDVAVPMLEVHIVQTLFLQKQTMAGEWERLCFLQREVTKLQKWLVSVFPSTAAHFVHQQPGTQIEAIGDALEVKLCKPILNYRIVTTRRIKSTCYHHFPVKLPYRNTTYFLKISDRHLLSKSSKVKCINRPLSTYLKDINGTYFLISVNGTITPMPVLEDIISELPYFQTTRIHGYDDRLLTHSAEKFEPYTMLEIFCDVHDAMQELKGLQMDHGDGDTLLGTGRALFATLESVAQGGSSVIKAIGGAIHDTLNGVGDLDGKAVGSLEEAASKVIESTGHAVKDSTTGIGNKFHGILGGIGGTIQWSLILAIILVLLYINRSALFKLCRNKRHLSQRHQQI